MTFQQIERQRESFRRKWEREFRDTLEDQFTIYIDVWRSTGNKRAARQAVEEPEPMRESYRKFYRAVGTYFAIKQYADLQKLKDAPPRDYWTDKIDDYVRRTGKTKAQAINAYSAELLGAMTSEVSLEVLDDVEYEKLGNDWRNIVITRSERIFQTEVVCASELGKVEAAKYVRDEEGLPTMKRWQANLDAGVREAHYYADGKEAELDEYFTVGGEQLRFPGDTSGGATAKNLINCRCANEYFKGDGVPKPPDAEPEPTSTEDLQREQEKQPEPKPVPGIPSTGRIPIAERKRVAGLSFDEIENQLDSLLDSVNTNALKIEQIQARQAELQKVWFDHETGSPKWMEIKEKIRALNKEVSDIVYENELLSQKAYDIISLPQGARSKVRMVGVPGQFKDKINDAVGYVESLVADGAMPRSPKITVKTTERGRSFYRPNKASGKLVDGTLHANKDADVGTLVHEIFHSYEAAFDGINADVKRYYTQRTNGDRLQWLGEGYEKTEMSRFDEWFDPYIGKDYYEQGHNASEVLTVAIQFAHDEGVMSVYQKDKDHFMFVLRLLQSSPF